MLAGRYPGSLHQGVSHLLRAVADPILGRGGHGDGVRPSHVEPLDQDIAFQVQGIGTRAVGSTQPDFGAFTQGQHNSLPPALGVLFGGQSECDCLAGFSGPKQQSVGGRRRQIGEIVSRGGAAKGVGDADGHRQGTAQDCRCLDGVGLEGGLGGGGEGQPGTEPPGNVKCSLSWILSSEYVGASQGMEWIVEDSLRQTGQGVGSQVEMVQVSESLEDPCRQGRQVVFAQIQFFQIAKAAEDPCW